MAFLICLPFWTLRKYFCVILSPVVALEIDSLFPAFAVTRCSSLHINHIISHLVFFSFPAFLPGGFSFGDGPRYPRKTQTEERKQVIEEFIYDGVVFPKYDGIRYCPPLSIVEWK